MRAIVTGSQGFIGRHLAAHLRAAGWDVHGIDVVEGADEVRDVAWAGIGERPADVLFHLAASPSRASHNEGTNAAMAKMAAYWANQNPASRVVFASTWMAGQAFCGYGKSKAEAERLLYYEISPRDRLRIVRLPNVYGPGGNGVVNLFRNAAEAGMPAVVHGDGTQTREFVTVYDAVQYLTQPWPGTAVLVQPEGAWRSIIGLAHSSGAEIINVTGPDYGPEMTRIPLTWDAGDVEKFLGERRRG